MKKGRGKNSKLLPNSLRIVSSCIKTVSTNASTVVRSAGASVAASIATTRGDKEQVLWASFDKLELSPTMFRRVLLLGYLKGFQVFDVEDVHRLSELVSKRYGPVTFLQMLPAPSSCNSAEYYKKSHPILVIVGGDEDEKIIMPRNGVQGFVNSAPIESSFGSTFKPPTAVRFYSMKFNEYVKFFDFKSAVFMVRCSPQVVAIGLEEQIYCLDSLTLEKKFIVVTYPISGFREHGHVGINMGYGPMDVGSRWLAYPPNRPFILNTGRVSPKSLASSVSPSTSPGSGTLMARYAVESSRNLAAGILTLGDMGYRKLSKYCPELLSDSPSSPGWKAGKLAAFEPENAGVVAVKDLVSSEVIAQFRAHTSPISALCFDPSGTLLVTASVHGNNINIFRIMPPHTCNGSACSDWSTSHVHLYKLYRGITTAVIQDICFSNYSQWLAIVSSKGTCHIFLLCPFGKHDGFQPLQSHEQGTSLFLASSPPWWSTSSFTMNEQISSPPPTCTASVVTRIKCSDSGLLNSVSNAAALMAGKISVPSGAVAAIFHNSNSSGSVDVLSSSTVLEHVLVYAPSGFVVQYEIRSLMGFDRTDSSTGSSSTLPVNPHEDFRVKVEPIQWWDVCRRLDDPERMECISGSIFNEHNFPGIDEDFERGFQENDCSGEKKLVNNSDSLKSAERAHWYLSNAEVQIHSCRLPIWQKSKIHFHVMKPPGAECYSGGEFEIETLFSHEVEIKQKILLPIFDHFPTVRPGLIKRSMASVEHDTSVSSDNNLTEKTSDANEIYGSNPLSFSSTESSEGDSSDSAADVLNTSRSEKIEDFGHFFNEGYCNKPVLPEHHKSTEVAKTDGYTGGNSIHDDEKSEEGWIGGMFEFSEEG